MNKRFQNITLKTFVCIAWISAIVFPISLIITLCTPNEVGFITTGVSFSTFISSVVSYVITKAAILYIENNKKEEK